MVLIVRVRRSAGTMSVPKVRCRKPVSTWLDAVTFPTRLRRPTRLRSCRLRRSIQLRRWRQLRRWCRVRQLTQDSPRNHTYVRRPVNAHPDFYAFWADGNALEPSESRLYFCDRNGNVRVLPDAMHADFETPPTL